MNEVIANTMQHETVEASEFNGNFSEVVMTAVSML